jgi:hypothetical protein
VAAQLGKVGGFKRFRKYAPLMNLPLEEYYQSRASDPFAFFNQDREKLTREFLATLNGNDPAQLAKKCFSLVAGLKDLIGCFTLTLRLGSPDDLLIKG